MFTKRLTIFSGKWTATRPSASAERMEGPKASIIASFIAQIASTLLTMEHSGFRTRRRRPARLHGAVCSQESAPGGALQTNGPAGRFTSTISIWTTSRSGPAKRVCSFWPAVYRPAITRTRSLLPATLMPAKEPRRSAISRATLRAGLGHPRSQWSIPSGRSIPMNKQWELASVSEGPATARKSITSLPDHR